MDDRALFTPVRAYSAGGRTYRGEAIKPALRAHLAAMRRQRYERPSLIRTETVVAGLAALSFGYLVGRWIRTRRSTAPHVLGNLPDWAVT